MNQEKTFEALNAIADEIEVAERAWLQAWARMSAPASETAGVSGDQLCDDLAKAEADLVAFMSTKVAQIAAITENSQDNIRLAFLPRKRQDETLHDGLSPAFPRSAFLRQVAKHRSFNSEYWAAEERRIEREAFAAKIDVDAPVVSVDEASRIMKEGGVPNVAADDFVRGRPLAKFEKEPQALSRLERAMVRAGLLTRYSEQWPDAFSTTQSVAFVLKGPHGESDGVYWTKKVARQRKEELPFEAVVEESVLDRPRG